MYGETNTQSDTVTRCSAAALTGQGMQTVTHKHTLQCRRPVGPTLRKQWLYKRAPRSQRFPHLRPIGGHDDVEVQSCGAPEAYPPPSHPPTPLYGCPSRQRCKPRCSNDNGRR